MSRVILLPLKRVAERQQISLTCLLSFLTLLCHERFYCSPYFSCWKIIHLFHLQFKMDFLVLSFAPCFIYFETDDGDKVNRRAQSNQCLMKCTHFYITDNKLLFVMQVFLYPYTSLYPRNHNGKTMEGVKINKQGE